MRRSLLSILAFLVTFYAFVFVWPTRWRYDHIGLTPIRTCRVTGKVQYCNLQGWHDQLPEPDWSRR